MVAISSSSDEKNMRENRSASPEKSYHFRFPENIGFPAFPNAFLSLLRLCMVI
jgi:hypothetical protein